MADKASSQQTADALFLLDALQHVTSTVMVSLSLYSNSIPPSYPLLTPSQINAGEIAAQKDAKVNTIQKRFTTLKQRYNLNIQTTAVGGGGAAGPATPSKPKPARVTKKTQTTPTKKTTPKKAAAAKAAAIEEQLEDESDEGMGKKAAAKTKGGDEEMGNFGMLSSE
jgi:hypothetical protein